MNPRYAINVRRFSRPVLSTTQPSLHKLSLKIESYTCDAGYLAVFSDYSRWISENDIKAWRCSTLTWGDPTLPSTLFRFTSEFGMESGGSKTLWSPSKFLKFGKLFFVLSTHSYALSFESTTKPLGCCMVKPHGQLVQVSSTPHNAYTPCLSTF